ncbi:MAG: hypothetical protein HY402_03920 [Elusimicrobia bacterium]|nr:hypothetical protein [Elusimicrobiota bacterium]
MLRKLWNLWQKSARRIGDAVARGVLLLIYGLAVCPTAFLAGIFRLSPWPWKDFQNSAWIPRKKSEDNLEKARSQY